MVIGGPVGPADVPGLSGHVRTLLEDADAEVIICDVGALTGPDIGTVDVLARLQLTALRLGRRLRLRHASSELLQLLVMSGLGDVVPPADGPD